VTSGSQTQSTQTETTKTDPLEAAIPDLVFGKSGGDASSIVIRTGSGTNYNKLFWYDKSTGKWLGSATKEDQQRLAAAQNEVPEGESLQTLDASSPEYAERLAAAKASETTTTPATYQQRMVYPGMR
jgi:hypothetical protein